MTSKAILGPALRSFERDEKKNELNRAKHGIDFEDATEVFYGPVLLYRSNRKNEERWIAIGFLRDRLIAVIFCAARRCHTDHLGAACEEE